jgi:hypothetical protein
MKTARTALASAALLALFSSAATAHASEAGVSIRDAVARVQVIPEARSDVQVEVRAGRSGLPTPRVWNEGAHVIVDGGLAHRIKGCNSLNVSFLFSGHHAEREHRAHVQVAGVGSVSTEDMPQITVRVPLDARVDAGGAVFGTVAPSRNLNLATSGCGDWRVEDVQQGFSIAQSGSGDVQAHHAGTLRAALSGSGDLSLDRVDSMANVVISGSADVRLASAGGLETRIVGSGDVRLGTVNGPINASISGSGDINIDGGSSSDVQVAIAGSGDFRLHGQAGQVRASVAGSGDITIDRATGPVDQRKAGSGDIHIGR